MRLRQLTAFLGIWWVAALLAVFFRTFRQIGFKEVTQVTGNAMAAMLGISMLIFFLSLPIVLYFEAKIWRAQGRLWRDGKKAAFATVLCAILDGAGMYLLFEALRLGSLSIVGPLRNTNVLFAFAAGYFILREREGWRLKLAGSFVIVAGVMIVKNFSVPTSLLDPSLLAIGSAIAFAGTALLTRRAQSEQIGMSANLFAFAFVTTSTAMFLIGLLMFDRQMLIDAGAAALYVFIHPHILLYAVVCGFLGTYFAAHALGGGPIIQPSAIFPLEIITSIIVGALFFDEAIGWQLVAGAFVLLVGVILVARPAKTR